MKTFTHPILNIILLLIIVSCGGNKQDKEAKTTIDPQNIKTVELQVEGMTCTGCEKTIEAGVKSLNGIASVEADHKAGKTIVNFDKETVSREAISKMIAEKGYKVVASNAQE